MTQIRRNWNKLNREERLALAATIVARAKDYPQLAANPAFAELTRAHDAAAASASVVRALEERLHALIARRAEDGDALLASLDAVATATEHTVRDPVKLAELGFETMECSSPRVPPMTRVINFSVTTGDFEGELDAHWDSVSGAIFYDLQIASGDPEDEANWKEHSPRSGMRAEHDRGARSSIARTKATLADLPSGKRLWVRVRAAGPDGPGPWSIPVTKVVP